MTSGGAWTLLPAAPACPGSLLSLCQPMVQPCRGGCSGEQLRGEHALQAMAGRAGHCLQLFCHPCTHEQSRGTSWEILTFAPGYWESGFVLGTDTALTCVQTVTHYSSWEVASSCENLTICLPWGGSGSIWTLECEPGGAELLSSACPGK